MTVIRKQDVISSVADALQYISYYHPLDFVQALEKASKLYDRLIVSGKLTEDWETGLKRVTIEIRNSKDKREYVVQFEKSKGEPSSVYFFFDQKGEYSGSNFTGK
mgnify:CR=1 FL=1